MDKEERLAEISKELRESLTSTVKNSQKRVDLLREDLDLQLHNLIKTYSIEIRNIAIASGVIAPLSLTLLQIETLSVFAPALVCGFVVLIANIALSHFFIYREVNAEDKRIRNVQVDLILADFSLFKLNEIPDNELPQRVLEAGEKNRRIESALNGLGYSKIANSKLELRGRYLRYHSITSLTFITGLLLIVSSLLVSHVTNFVLEIVHFSFLTECH